MATGKLHDRLYQNLARSLLDELACGRYQVGSRLPAERDLAIRFEVSRPTVREAIIALEVQGLVEVKIGSGAYVKRLPSENDRPGFNVTAFELTEARLLFEGEAAALAATQMTDEDLAEIAILVQKIAEENQSPNGTETADREFHLAVAKATRNVAVYNTVAQLWDLRGTSPEAALLHEKARHANVKPVVEEHNAILDALRARDPNAARAAMRAHLSAVLEGLLFATEERALAEARRATQTRRERYARATA
ncbi:FadR/GntR family transcriptional regulator [Novosphingobium mathurense]|uniref:Transcriptional regulator, GntR family n=1 Tax=Novosphingobium mathurense TaxID=428990 RepID=A0A1U6IRQ6_9SPHN|nr:FadR/GntR family transcriptional regulator [Novosphingobium mathurense]SLK10703.1 transcriptional regulator, GntR family [Novosphingobium mathurense]